MIPLRLELEGFLTYRERQVLDFSDLRVGVIVGSNGDGKSALFDAVTFGLYGEHRGGAQHAERLINHACTKLAVRFDFEVAGQRYRVDRSVMRVGRHLQRTDTTAQAYRWDGADWRPIAEGSGTAECTSWVTTTLGMNHDVFVASILLRQNDQDRFLRAKPRERQGILNALLDLGPYERLEDAARERRNDVGIEVASLARQLLDLPAHDPETLATAHDALEGAKQAMADADVRLRLLQEIRADAARYTEATKELTTVDAQIATTQSLLENEGDIRARAARQRLLDGAVSRIEVALKLDEAARQNDDDAEHDEHEAAAIDLVALENAQAAASDVVNAAKAARDERNRELGSLRNEEQALRPKGHALEQADRFRRDASAARLHATEDAIAASTFDALNAEVDRLTEVKIDLPWLRRIAIARADKSAADADLVTADGHILATTGERKQAAEKLVAAKAAHDAARNACVGAERARADADAVVKERKRQIAARHEAEGETTCSRCGQPIDAEHLAREIADLDGAIAVEIEAARLAGEKLTEAQSKERHAGEAVTTAQGELDASEAKLTRLQRDHEKGEEKAGRAAEARTEAMANLSTEMRARADIDHAYPSKKTLDCLSSEVDHLLDRGRELKIAAAARERQERALDLACSLDKQATKLEESVPVAERELVRQRWTALAGDLDEASRLVEGANRKWEEALDAADETSRKLQTGQNNRDRLLHLAVRLRQTAMHNREQRDEILEKVPPEIRPVVLDATNVESLVAELGTLTDAPKILEALSRADATLVQLRLQRQGIVDRIAGVPEQARCSPEDVDAKLSQLGKEIPCLKQRYNEADFAQRQADAAAERADDWEQRLREKQRREADWRLLERLLGRKHIQNALVEHARIGIVEAANRELAEISNGTLNLELQRNASDELELLVTDATSVEHPIDGAYLSGSQRFRVAVALALGIGQYHGGASRGPRAVIIDEGFGSLDQDGLQAMGEHLRDLASRLEKVIVVTHQQGLQQYFPDGFHVIKRDGTTRVIRLKVGLD